MKSIAIFGGTFDPVHLGHLELVKAARQSEDLDQVMFMPCWQSPFKGKTIANGQQRYHMLELAIAELGMGDWATVGDFEINRETPSYSWQTVAHFREQMPDVNWHWIVCTDQWRVIDRWAEADKLRQWLSFIVLTRDGEKVESRSGWSHRSVAFEHPASASEIRADFTKFGETWLASSVYRFCFENIIYG